MLNQSSNVCGLTMSNEPVTRHVSETYKRHFRERERHDGKRLSLSFLEERTSTIWSEYRFVAFRWLRLTCQPESLSRWQPRWIPIFYGIGAALTLDEFALWLNLRDVYCEAFSLAPSLPARSAFHDLAGHSLLRFLNFVFEIPTPTAN